MKYIPIALIYSRLVIGFGIIALSAFHISHYSLIAIILLSVGLLTDVFDGIIARKLNISSEKLRRLDSGVDQVFFISFGVATYIQCPDFFKTHVLKLGVLLFSELMIYVLSFIKFRKEVATHSIAAKIWTLFLFATLVELVSHCKSDFLFEVCLWTGLISRIEIMAIVLALKKWTNDVPTFYHALILRKGKDIKRNKLFNG